MNARMLARLFRNSFSFAVSLSVCCGSLAQTNSLSRLREQFQKVSQAAQGRVGIAVELLETHEHVELNAEERFPMQSVYKLPIGMTVLHQVDSGLLALDRMVRVETNDLVPPQVHSPIRDEHPDGTEMSVRALMRAMVLDSDGTASDVLLRLIGGAKPVQDYLRGLGVTNVIVATTEKAMGRDDLVQYRNWATPEGMRTLLESLQAGRGLSTSSRTLLLQLLTETSTGPGRIKGMLPTGTVVAHKTGSSRTVAGLTRDTNDAGLVTLPDGRHLAVVVFVSDSTADDVTREEVIAKAARAAWDVWAKTAGTTKRM